MFSKIDKKILIWLIAALVIIALVGIATYKRYTENAVKIQNSEGGASVENVGAEVNLGGVETDKGSSSGGFTVCLDECGDSICQTKDLECPDSSLNCICPETPADCPQDCGS